MRPNEPVDPQQEKPSIPGDKPKGPPAPRWAWPFAVACFAIPVISLGGAIPAMIGVGGGLGCLAIARRLDVHTRKKIFLCSGVTVGAWAAFLGFAVGVAMLTGDWDEAQKPPQPNRTQIADPGLSAGGSDEIGALVASEDIEDDANRRRIYKKAITTRSHIEFAQNQRASLLSKGFDTSAIEEQIERLEEMNEKHLVFIARFYKISRNELDDIIAEGDRRDWPR